MLGDEQVRHARAASGESSFDGAMLLVEDRRTLLDIELEDVAGRKPKPEADGDDAAGRRAGDEVEVAADRMFEMLFETRQEGGRKHAADAAAVERQDAEELLSPAVPSKRSVHAASSLSSSPRGACRRPSSRRMRATPRSRTARAPSTARSSDQAASTTAIRTFGQIEAELRRLLLIEMRNAPPAGQRVQIRTLRRRSGACPPCLKSILMS